MGRTLRPARRTRPSFHGVGPGSSVAAVADTRTERIAVAMGLFFTFAGLMHALTPAFFDAIVPPWLPPGERFWTYASGLAEVVVGPLLLIRRTRRGAAYAAMVLLVAVYPANLYMAWDWRDRPVGEQLIAYGRLPFQFLFVWLAWQVARGPQPSGPARPFRPSGAAGPARPGGSAQKP